MMQLVKETLTKTITKSRVDEELGREHYRHVSRNSEKRGFDRFRHTHTENNPYKVISTHNMYKLFFTRESFPSFLIYITTSLAN